MNLKLYMDQHIPMAVVLGLRAREIDVLTTFEDSRELASDEEILTRATELKRIVFTQDTDFIDITHIWLQTRQPFSGVAFAHQQKSTIGSLVNDLEIICKIVTEEEVANQLIRIPF